METEETKRKNVFQKGVGGQKAKKKDGILKGKPKGKQGPQKNRKKRRILNASPLGS